MHILCYWKWNRYIQFCKNITWQSQEKSFHVWWHLRPLRQGLGRQRDVTLQLCVVSTISSGKSFRGSTLWLLTLRSLIHPTKPTLLVTPPMNKYIRKWPICFNWGFWCCTSGWLSRISHISFLFTPTDTLCHSPSPRPFPTVTDSGRFVPTLTFSVRAPETKLRKTFPLFANLTAIAPFPS